MTDLELMGNRLRQIRENKELTLKQVSEALGLAKSTISYHEKGQREFSATDLHRYCKYYGVTMDWVGGYSDDPYNTRYTSEEKSLIKKYRTASNKDRIIAHHILSSDVELGERNVR